MKISSIKLLSFTQIHEDDLSAAEKDVRTFLKEVIKSHHKRDNISHELAIVDRETIKIVTKEIVKICERYNDIRENTKMAEQYQHKIKLLEQKLESHKALLEEKDKRMEEKDKRLEDKDEIIEDKDKLIEVKNEIIALLKAQIKKK